MSKVKDYGVFGKWSIETLVAQSTRFSDWEIYLPESVKTKKCSIDSDITEIRRTKLKKLTILELQTQLRNIEENEEHLEKYNEMVNDIKDYYKKKEKR
ncbi:hypothetical protein LCGC14_3115370 [marine sediment metagenome]|uniref:Uncharacterized protein n=1 Tax=marine sediment metagenome TaxID=412755 RepID=A0A0F8YTT9_9ZZZZ